MKEETIPMKANELRIGNYVNSSIEEIGILRVSTINNTYINGCDIKFLHPIPLTEEWLIKLGFEKEEPYSWNGNGHDWQPETNRTECVDFVKDEYFIRFERWGYESEEQKQWVWSEQVLFYHNEWYARCKDNQVYANINYVHNLQNLIFCLTGEELTLTP